MNKFLTAVVAAMAVCGMVVASPVRSNLGGDGVENAGPSNLTPADYVQDGLFAMWDGEWNIGWGEHDESATYMADLGPYGLNFSLNTAAGYQFEELSLFVPKNYYTPRTINLSDAAHLELMTALSNGTFTIEYVWEDLGSNYNTSDGLGVMGPVKMLGARDSIAGCRVDSFRGDFWSSGYGYYWGPVIKMTGIQNGGSYSAAMCGLETEYKLRTAIRYNDLYCTGMTPNDTSTLHGTWVQRVGAIFTTKQIILFYDRNRQMGRLYSLRIYTRMLTMEEMANNYRVDKERFGL